MILANNFDVLLGRIEVVVPFVEPGSDYSLVCEYSLYIHVLLTKC